MSGREKDSWTALEACTVSTCTRLGTDTVDAVRSMVADCAGMPAVRANPEAAAITAAERPMDPALDETALEIVSSGLVRTETARWRPVAVLLNTLKASPNACEVSCRIRMGVHPAVVLPGKSLRVLTT
jgi:hypothetical protein